jgi:hypothetical protein
MNSIVYPIRFWILMAVLGSSASGADDPPIGHPFEETIGKQGAARKETVKPGTSLMNGVAHRGTPRALVTVADPKGELKFPKVSDIRNFLKGDS